MGQNTGNDFDIVNKILDDTITGFIDFIQSNETYCNELYKLKKDYSTENSNDFNIFTSISDLYKRENLHSDILKFIFDPQNTKISNKKFLEVFLEVINKKLKHKIKLDLDTVIVEREKHRIDIFIHDANKVGIIIENKSNNARDQYNQIGKYYEEATEDGINVKAIVYMPLSPEKKLDREYSIKENKNKIEDILVELPIVNRNNELCLVNDVIDKCIPLANNPVSEVYLSEFSNLLKYLGGEFMCSELDKKALYEIFKDEKTLESFKIMGKLWDNREGLIGNVFKDYFQNQLKFKIHSGDPDNAVFKSIKEGINIGFDTACDFGFVYTPGTQRINPELRRKLKPLIGNEKLSSFFKEDKPTDDGSWIYKHIDYNRIKSLSDLKTLVDTFEEIINADLENI